MAKGIYILIISVAKDINVNVGALGKIGFEKGFYAYVGSAQNNLEKRIKRHLGRAKRKFWHIDYLLRDGNVAVLSVLYKEGRRPEECRIAKIIGENGKVIKSFGSSDCKCKSHLFKVSDFPLFFSFRSYESLASQKHF